jgi:inosine/xanthosine triphosphate pyrophosphatase family protein
MKHEMTKKLTLITKISSATSRTLLLYFYFVCNAYINRHQERNNTIAGIWRGGCVGQRERQSDGDSGFGYSSTESGQRTKIVCATKEGRKKEEENRATGDI